MATFVPLLAHLLMDIFRKVEPLRDFLRLKRGNNASIGLVATMGALHQGHAALIRTSRAENAITVCSIYVNPTQFENTQDLDNYPCKEQDDLALLEAEQCDVVFVPHHADMYGTATGLRFNFGHLGEVMEGYFRPGHFNGVALAVAKLFNIVQPDVAYFGQKDYQQFKIVALLREELKFPLRLQSIPPVREPDGLAFSSRNRRLTNEERKKALSLFGALRFAEKAIQKGVHFAGVRKEIESRFAKTGSVRLEYFELADCDTLELLHDMGSLNQAIVLIAGYVGNIRLIDNLIVTRQ